MNPLNQLRDFADETTSQRALDRRIREAVSVDPDAARIFKTAGGRPQRIARGVGNPWFDQRSDELQQYAKAKSDKNEFHLFKALFR